VLRLLIKTGDFSGRQELNRIVEKIFEEEVSFLQDLIRIESEQGEAYEGEDGQLRPFGKGPAEALSFTLCQGEKLGFTPLNDDWYGGHLEYGSGKPICGIPAHLDVVPAGSGWSFDPYSGEIEDGFMTGRGTTDDKGPLVASLFAMKALKDMGYEPEGSIRLILGCDEENDWVGMKHYIENVGPADYGFTPDGDFPVVNGEKGIATFDLVKKLRETRSKGLELRSLEGGSAHNMVAEGCRALLNSSDDRAYDEIRSEFDAFKEEFKDINGIKPTFGIKGSGKSLEISIRGKSSHAANPSKGLNAISLMMNFLGRLNFASEDLNDTISFYNKHIGFNIYGENIGCSFEDEESGKLTWNVGLVSFDKKSISFNVDVRYPVTTNREDIIRSIREFTDEYDIGIVIKSDQKPIYFDPESESISLLMDIYRAHTGDMESGPIVMGGGTYARAMKNFVAFGGAFPGDPDLMHQKDEKISLDRLMTMTKIYAEAILRMTGGEISI
jgi:succinyl-diaminopimelate desuccinylase